MQISGQKGTPKGDQTGSGGRKADDGAAASSNAGGGTGAGQGGGSGGVGGGGGGGGGQQQDWSILWSCFENPLTLLSTSESLPKGMQVRIIKLICFKCVVK